MTNLIEGDADTAFAPCLEAFRSNFTEDGELGAACAIYRNGEPVMDAWGGTAVAASGEPWLRDTVVPFFSVTKGIAALCVLTQVAQGLLELDRPVSCYWPEFGAHGKDGVTIRQALAHRAGVPALGGAITPEHLAHPAEMATRLAAEPPLFEPNSAHMYHALTIGWITGELVRRVTGQPLGAWFREHLAAPLALNLQIGRVPSDGSPIAHFEVPAERDTPPLDPSSFPGTVLSLNGLISPRMSGLAAAMNDPVLQRVELAGANGLGDARSLAKLYSSALSGASGPLALSAELIRDACEPVSEGQQWQFGQPGPTWGAGLMLPWRVQPMLGPGSFGHDGAGGALAFAHAPSGVSFAYVRNRAGQPDSVDPLVYRVVDALAGCLGFSIPRS